MKLIRLLGVLFGIEVRNEAYWVSWDKCCLPKEQGRLRLWRTSDMNDAFLAKLSWGLLEGCDADWAQLITHKYFCSGSPMVSEQKQGESFICRALRCGIQLVRNNIRWDIYNGSRALFWLDVWVGNEALVHYALCPILDDVLHLCVHDFVNDDGSWKWHLFAQFLPHGVNLQIAAGI